MRDPLGMPFAHRLRYWLIAAIGLVVIGVGGWLIYEFTIDPAVPRSPVTAEIVSVLPVRSGKSMSGSSTQVIMIVRTSSGWRNNFQLPLQQASRCRVGSSITLWKVKTYSGIERLLIDVDPCT